MNELSEATLRPALRDTSPALITVPVNDGAARGALRSSVPVNPALTIAPLMYKFPLNELSEPSTVKFLLTLISPSETMSPVKEGDTNKFANSAFMMEPLMNILP